MFHISYSRNSPPQIVNSYVICPLRFSFSYFWKGNLKRETLDLLIYYLRTYLTSAGPEPATLFGTMPLPSMKARR